MASAWALRFAFAVRSLDGSRNGRPRDLRNQALLHEAHNAMSLQGKKAESQPPPNTSRQLLGHSACTKPLSASPAPVPGLAIPFILQHFSNRHGYVTLSDNGVPRALPRHKSLAPRQPDTSPECCCRVAGTLLEAVMARHHARDHCPTADWRERVQGGCLSLGHESCQQWIPESQALASSTSTLHCKRFRMHAWKKSVLDIESKIWLKLSAEE